jgi:hypothetical protein
MIFEYTYLFFFLIPCFFILDTFKLSNKLSFISWNSFLFLLFLFIGSRYQVGGDWLQYMYSFHIDRDYINFSEDIGYELLIYLLNYFDRSILSLNLISAAVFIYGLSKFAERQSCKWTVMVIASSYLTIVVGMGYTRQALAVGFAFLALNALIDKKIITSIMFVILGSLFHISLIAFSIIYISLIKYKHKYIVLVFFILFFIYIIFQSQIPFFKFGHQINYDKINRLIFFFIVEGNDMYLSKGAIIRLFINFFCAILFIIFSKNFTSNLIERKIYFIISIFVVILFLLSFQYSVLADRLNIYFMVLQLFVLSRAPYIFKTIINLNLTKILISSFFGLFLIIWLNNSPYVPAWTPYQNYLFPHTNKWHCNKDFDKDSIVALIVCNQK